MCHILAVVTSDEAREPFAPLHTFFPGTLCSWTSFPPWNSLLFNTFGSLEPFAPENTLLFNTFCSLEHFASLHLLLPGTLSSSVYFPLQHILLLGILLTMILIIKKKQVSDSNFRVKKLRMSDFWVGNYWAKCSRKQTVQGSKVL